ncbi:MAG: hypothetical protein NT069_24440 [Planctomycetota bacterium]|nr:hypothetical protein [Planctomycetota bacterium]
MKRLLMSLSAVVLAAAGSGCCCMDSCCKPCGSPCGNPCGNPCGAQTAPYGAQYTPPAGAYVTPYGGSAISAAPPVTNTTYYSGPTMISALPPWFNPPPPAIPPQDPVGYHPRLAFTGQGTGPFLSTAVRKFVIPRHILPRTPRVPPGGMLLHVLNRGVGRQQLFGKPDDFAAFEEIVASPRLSTYVQRESGPTA